LKRAFLRFEMLWIFRFFSIWPMAALHVLGGALGWAVWASNAGYRARFRSNVQQAGLDFDEATPAIAETGRLVAELPKLWLRPHEPPALQSPQLKVTLLGTEQADRAFAKGKGVIFFGAHCGCFELMPQVLAEAFGPAHGDITAIYRPARQASLAAIELATRQRPYLTVLPGSLSAIRAMHKALKANRAVAMLTDQVPPEGLGVWSPFFGKPAYTMTLAARLALQSGAALVPVVCKRLASGSGYVITIWPPLAVPGDMSEAVPDGVAQATPGPNVESVVAQINQSVEAMVRQNPGQYLWAYGRYKTPRSGTP
jgi:Kdo2-lipid IVA lauroyltransferase/acyltransferase